MTCSCTRTEVIEKEPSIYDDYSVYESQYGYAGKQGPYSESDLGSDYGDGSQTGDRGRGSEAGTLASRSQVIFQTQYITTAFYTFLWSGILKDRRPSHHTIEVYTVAPTSIKAAETHPSVITQTHHQSIEIITCNFE